MSMRFSNKHGSYKTLGDFDPTGTMTNVPFYDPPTPIRPFVGISGDIKLRGAIRFSDGTSLETATGLGGGGGGDLDFTDLPLAGTLPIEVTTDNTYIATQVNSTMSKMSLESLSNYVASGFASIGNNCNLVFTDIENKSKISTTDNSNSIFIGCDVATSATGWKHSVMIGTQAGAYATTPNNFNGVDEIDTACTFIGYRAGYEADNINNSVFIGTSAGENSDSAEDSIFIGSSAGLNSTSPNCIGIGEHALRGEISKSEGGSKNIEIVAGLLDNQRLMYASGELSDRLNIQNTIAGNTDKRRLSIGDAILDPDAPLSVRRSTSEPGHNITSYIQSWHQDDLLKAYVNPSGNFVAKIETEQSPGANEDNKIVPAMFGHLEGICTAIAAPASIADPTKGRMQVKVYNNFDGYTSYTEEGTVWVTNRDPNLTIHADAYVITARINDENRPIYVSCPPS